MTVNPTGVDHDPVRLAERQATVDRLLIAEGAGHVVHDLPVRSDGRSVALASRPWRLDPIPYRISAEEFLWLDEAVRRRMAMLESLLDDLYGDRRLVAEGVIDPALLWSSPRYRLAAVGAAERREQKRWLSVYAVDVARTVDGVWFAITDHTDAPSGIGYALLDRAVLGQVAGPELASARRLSPMLRVLRQAFDDTTPSVGPRVAVFSGGIDHPAYIEHSYLATALGYNLVEGPDLVVRDRHLWLQTLGGLEAVDVLYRRLSDWSLDPMETNTTGSSGVPGVLLANESGGLALANAHGTGVLQDPVLARLWDRAGQELTGDEPWLRLRRDDGTIDSILGRPAERVDTWFDDRLVEQPVVLRFHAVATDEGITVMPGANGRVLAVEDDPRLPSPCLAKDVWVSAEPSELVPSFPVREALVAPQVDLITSVPTRAADSLYWLSRAAERSEAVARACRVVAGSPIDAIGEGPPDVALQLLDALTGPDVDLAAVGAPDDDGTRAAATERETIVVSAGQSLDYHVGSMLAESASVREFLSTTTGRVLGELVTTRERLTSRPLDVDALDVLLTQLSAFSGLWSESVVRGPAWYFGDFARRYERAVVALTGAAAAVRCAADPLRDPGDRRRGLESVLAANDSLVAYRRRHRSDVEIQAVLSLLLHDDRNPRSAGASMAGLDRNARSIGWFDGTDVLAEIRRDLDAVEESVDVDPAELESLITRLHSAAAALHSTELMAPPHPMLVRSSAVVDPGAVA